MLSKEEIEKAKENITKYLNDIWFGTLYSQEENDRDEKILLEYIDQLETDKQKLIEKLEEDIVNANDNIKHMEEKNILQTIARELEIGMRDYAQEILEIVKGVENERA